MGGLPLSWEETVWRGSIILAGRWSKSSLLYQLKYAIEGCCSALYIYTGSVLTYYSSIRQSLQMLLLQIKHFYGVTVMSAWKYYKALPLC